MHRMLGVQGVCKLHSPNASPRKSIGAGRLLPICTSQQRATRSRGPAAEILQGLQAMRSAYGQLILSLILFLVANDRDMARVEPAGDPLGKRFLCSDVSTKNLCLPILLSGCRMTLESGSGIPSEPDEKV